MSIGLAGWLSVWACAEPPAPAEPGIAAAGERSSVAIVENRVARASSAVAAPDRADPPPAELQGVELVEKRDQPLPLDTPFMDADGRPVKLREFFDGKRPVILTLNYFRCPMLCGLQLTGLLNGLKELNWDAGDKFQLVTISFDPLEDHVLAYQKRQSYLREYGRTGGGWQFLTGRSASIKTICDATGYNVKWNNERQEWMHPSAIMICTPDGRISRYLVGLEYQAQTLKLSLLEAAEGKIGSAAERFMMYCFHYDAKAGKYGLAAMNIVRAGGAASAIILGIFVWRLWRRDQRRLAEITAQHPTTTAKPA